MIINELLLIPEKADPERAQVAEVWQQKGGQVKIIGKFWLKPETEGKRVTIYGNDTFSLVLAQVLNVKLLMPNDEIIAEVGAAFLKREVKILIISDKPKLNFPIFIKPVKPKLFRAKVYPSLKDFNAEIQDLPTDEKIIVSEVIEIQSEIRSFISHEMLQDLAVYEGDAEVEEGEKFIEQFLDQHELDLPTTYVLDIGFNVTKGWFIIEFNATWGAGLNFCDPQKVVSSIRAATVN